MARRFETRRVVLGLSLLVAGPFTLGAERSEHFDQDPGWDARHHRLAATESVRQDFGYSPTAHAGGEAGEIGGFISPAGEPAYYAARIPNAKFDEPLSASGTLACGERPFHVLVGFFHTDTLNEWRTPNTISLRLMGRGTKFFAFVEYCTAQWRAGGDSPRSFPMVPSDAGGRPEPEGFAAGGQVHRWSLRYDPAANENRGAITAVIDGQTAVCHLEEGHKQDGARFNRFGVMTVMKSADTGGELWLDDIEVGDRRYDFDDDPQWDAVGNRRTYASAMVRPQFDFGYSPTNFAGGRDSGELGGVVFRGDCRYPQRMAYYADTLEPLSLDGPIRAGGKVALRRGVSDSTVLFGFFNARQSTASNPAQDSGLPATFLGISTDGPSRDGFFFSPTYRLGDNTGRVGGESLQPSIRPDGKSHDWTFDYRPNGGDQGTITVTLDAQSINLPLDGGARQSGVRFDRFGIITTWIDGNSQTIYFDDLTHTCRSRKRCLTPF